MINIRYHIVSITAVFLALAIGLLVGSTFISGETVKTLESRLDEQEANLDLTVGESDDLQFRVTELEELSARLEEAGPGHFFEHRLRNTSVLLVTAAGTAPETLEQVTFALQQSDAVAAGVLTFNETLSAEVGAELAESLTEDRFVLSAVPAASTITTVATTVPPITIDETPDQLPTLEELAELLGLASSTTTTTIPATTTTTIAAGISPTVQSLIEAGVATYTASIRSSARANVIIFVFDETSNIDVAASLLPVVTALSSTEDPRAVVASTSAETAVIGEIRSDTDLALRIPTVSHLDSVIGQLAAILALEDLEVQFVDHYGRESELELLPPGEL